MKIHTASCPRQTGFTLIELMLVVAIIAILTAIALPAYQDFTARAQMAEALTLAGGSRASVTEYWWNHGKAPANNAQAGVSDSIKGNHVKEVLVNNGVITATMRNDNVAAPLRGKTLSLTPTFPSSTQGSVIWTCSTDAAPRYVPSSCR